MAWIAIALSSAAFSGVLSIIDKQTVSKYMPNFGGFALLLGLASILWSILTFIFFPISQDLSLREALIALGSGVIWSAALGLHMFVLRTGEVSRVSPVFHTYPVIVAVLGVSFLNESLSWIGWIAILLTIVGAILISTRGLPVSSGPRFSRAMGLLLLASLCAAVGQITSKHVLDTAPFWNVFALRNLGIALPFFLFLSRSSVSGLLSAVRHPVGRYYVLLGEFIYGGFAVGWTLFAINSGPVSVVSALVGTRPVFVFLYSSILSSSLLGLMNEPVNPKTLAVKAVAIAMVVVGVGVITIL